MDDELTLEEVSERLKKLEHEVFEIKKRRFVEDFKKDTEKLKENEFSGATGGVRFLLSEKFFDHKRSLADVRDKLTEHGYHYSLQAVQMAVNRLSKSSGPLVTFKEGGKKQYAKRK